MFVLLGLKFKVKMAIINKINSLSNFDLPRTISVGLKIKIFFSNPFAVMGVVFFLFGSIFPIVFGSMADFRSTFSFSNSDPLVKGVIVAIEKTNNKVNKRNVLDYTYQYNVNGKSYTNHSFSTLSDRNEHDTVNVQYLIGEPTVSKIQDMRAAPFGFFIIPLTCIFPILGLIFLVFSIRTAKKNIYLVQNGVLTTGKVVRKEPTSTKINKQTVYKVFFQFKTQDGNLQEAFVRNHVTHNLGDEAEEPLVYDSQDPSSAVLLDSLPKKLRPLITGV